jgi:hypothetical protein
MGRDWPRAAQLSTGTADQSRGLFLSMLLLPSVKFLGLRGLQEEEGLRISDSHSSFPTASLVFLIREGGL